MKIERIKQIKELLSSVPRGPWHFCPSDDFDHWEIWSNHPEDNMVMVQDDSGVEPDENFINFVLKAREIIEELLKEIEER